MSGWRPFTAVQPHKNRRAFFGSVNTLSDQDRRTLVQGARLELAQIEAAQSRLLQMAWLAPRAELALPQELAEDFLTTVLAAAHTEYLFIYVFSDQISDVCQTSDPV